MLLKYLALCTDAYDDTGPNRAFRHIDQSTSRPTLVHAAVDTLTFYLACLQRETDAARLAALGCITF